LVNFTERFAQIWLSALQEFPFSVYLMIDSREMPHGLKPGSG